ncbi:NAD(P)-dependent oxidoreductase [Brachybacterium phenoliresistens]|uniref:NAD(P)-dependent oxidoreductase n=1 Tax=Brachybacterium phenoliresistens TaxID=396014 RepID=UPI0031DB6421
MRITTLGGTGYAGAELVREAAARGHEVTSFSRSAAETPVDGVRYVHGSALEEAELAPALEGAEVVVSALAPRGPLAGRTRELLAGVADTVAASGVRLGVIGGAGSLQVAEGGPLLVDTPDFPEAFRAEAREMTAVLDDLRGRDDQLDWFFVSPAAGFGAHAPGAARGQFRIGSDVLLADENGASELSAPDLASAILDEIEAPAHRRARFTVAY